MKTIRKSWDWPKLPEYWNLSEPRESNFETYICKVDVTMSKQFRANHRITNQRNTPHHTPYKKCGAVLSKFFEIITIFCSKILKGQWGLGSENNQVFIFEIAKIL